MGSQKPVALLLSAALRSQRPHAPWAESGVAAPPLSQKPWYRICAPHSSSKPQRVNGPPNTVICSKQTKALYTAFYSGSRHLSTSCCNPPYPNLRYKAIPLQLLTDTNGKSTCTRANASLPSAAVCRGTDGSEALPLSLGSIGEVLSPSGQVLHVCPSGSCEEQSM